MNLIDRVQRSHQHFRRDVRGNVAMIFALAMIPIFSLAGLAIDYQMATTSKGKVQSALDGAMLAATHALQAGRTEAQMSAEASTYFVKQMAANDTDHQDGFSVAGLSCGPLQMTYIEPTGEIDGVVNCKQETTLSKVMGHNYIDFNVRSAATAGMGSLEVALILDVTGSMAGSRITALRAAAIDFIDIVIKDEQVPFYSKASIIPYAVAVNAGTYADSARGTILPGVSISDAQWRRDMIPRVITGITRANPAVVTSTAHGLANGDTVWISGVLGMTQVNNRAYTVAGVTANTFQLQGTNSSTWSNYTGSGQIQRCLNANCAVTVTANNHGFNNGDHVVVTGVNGLTGLNTGAHVTWTVSNRTTNTFVATGSVGPTAGSAYLNGGTVWCTTYGCRFFRFLNRASNAQRVHEVSTCVTERIGPHAWNDNPPSTALVGLNYPSTSNPCFAANTILPLTSHKPTLRNKVNQLSAAGSTAGHLGPAWGWYTLSPHWASLFPPASRGAAYNTNSLFKVAVLMTDGEYNSAYCSGVIAGDSTSGSGSPADQINCNAPNGHSFDQALNYCAAMKNAGITIYTIGFEVVNDPRAQRLVRECASSPGHAYMATGSTQLRDVFKSIARAINEVRLTR